LLEVNVTIDGNDALSLPLDVRIAFFRITQEALNNIVKHAQAKKVDVYLWRAEGQAKMIIRDNGHGFNVNSSSAGIGLKSMMERSHHVGAQVQVVSEPGQGTEVMVQWEVSAP
jgi:signal transduction histidine kinase